MLCITADGVLASYRRGAGGRSRWRVHGRDIRGIGSDCVPQPSYLLRTEDEDDLQPPLVRRRERPQMAVGCNVSACRPRRLASWREIAPLLGEPDLVTSRARRVGFLKAIGLHINVGIKLSTHPQGRHR